MKSRDGGLGRDAGAKVRRGAAVAVLAFSGAVLAGCTSEDLDPPVAPSHHAESVHRRGPDEEGAGRGGTLFISPSGEPFRSRAGEPYPVVVWFNQADADKDGHLTAAEFRADAERFFRTLDLNHDGVLDPAEIGRYEHDVVPEILGRHAQTLSSTGVGKRGGRRSLGLAQVGMPGGGGGGGGPGGGGGGRRGGGEQSEPSTHSNGPSDTSASEGAGPYGLLGEPEPVTSADGNFDGKVTLGEFDARADQRFRVLDTAGKGYLLLADLPETPVQARDGGRRTPLAASSRRRLRRG